MGSINSRPLKVCRAPGFSIPLCGLKNPPPVIAFTKYFIDFAPPFFPSIPNRLSATYLLPNVRIPHTLPRIETDARVPMAKMTFLTLWLQKPPPIVGQKVEI